MARFWTGFALVVLAIVSLPAAAHAQASNGCAGGRTITSQTAGRCCWPGQGWDAAARACAGPPQCPEGLVGHGDECIPAANPQPVQAAQPAPQPVIGQPVQVQPVQVQPIVQAAPPPVIVNNGYVVQDTTQVQNNGYLVPYTGPPQRRHGGGAAIAFGVIFLLVGVGDLVLTGVFAAEGEGGVAGIFAACAVVDIVGSIALLAFGSHKRHEYASADAPPSRRARWAVVPTAPGAPLGASVVVAHF